MNACWVDCGVMVMTMNLSCVLMRKYDVTASRGAGVGGGAQPRCELFESGLPPIAADSDTTIPGLEPVILHYDVVRSAYHRCVHKV